MMKRYKSGNTWWINFLLTYLIRSRAGIHGPDYRLKAIFNFRINIFLCCIMAVMSCKDSTVKRESDEAREYQQVKQSIDNVIGWVVNKDNARWTGVLEKRDGKWVIVQQHFSFPQE